MRKRDHLSMPRRWQKLSSTKWKTIDQAEKKKYKDQYDALLIEYRKKKSDYDKKSTTSLSELRTADNDEKMKEDAMERAKKTKIPLAKLAETYSLKNKKRVPKKHADDIVYIVRGLSAWSEAPKLPSGLPDGWQWRINVGKKTLVSLYRSPGDNPKLFHKLQHARISLGLPAKAPKSGRKR